VLLLTTSLLCRPFFRIQPTSPFDYYFDGRNDRQGERQAMKQGHSECMKKISKAFVYHRGRLAQLTGEIGKAWSTHARVEKYIDQLCQRRLSSVTHTTVCLTTCSQPLPKRVLHTLRSSASFFFLISLILCFP
jgi:hypothetical protein